MFSVNQFIFISASEFHALFLKCLLLMIARQSSVLRSPLASFVIRFSARDKMPPLWLFSG